LFLQVNFFFVKSYKGIFTVQALHLHGDVLSVSQTSPSGIGYAKVIVFLP